MEVRERAWTEGGRLGRRGWHLDRDWIGEELPPGFGKEKLSQVPVET